MHIPKRILDYIATSDPLEDICKSPLLWLAIMLFSFYPSLLLMSYGAEWTHSTWWGKIVSSPTQVVEARISDESRAYWRQNAALARQRDKTGPKPEAAYRWILWGVGAWSFGFLFGSLWFCVRRLPRILSRVSRQYLQQQLQELYTPVREDVFEADEL